MSYACAHEPRQPGELDVGVGLPGLEGDCDVFVYGCGVVGRWLAASGDPRLRGFIDTDRKKVGRTFHGLRVFGVDEVAPMLGPNSLVLVTVADIADVVPTMQRMGISRWTAAGSLLGGVTVSGSQVGESDEFVQYAVDTVVRCHAAYFDSSRVFLRSVDLVITERCTLKCRDCANLMQYYERPRNIPYDEVVDDFDALAAATDEISEIRLIGGEPFLNADVYRVISHIVGSPKVGRVVLYTNATIPLKESEAPTLLHPKLVFTLTDYGHLSKNTEKVVDYLRRHRIPHRVHPPENWTRSGEIVDSGRSEDELVDFFSDCCGKNLYTVTNGHLYRCPFAANADRLGAIPLDPRNGVSLDAGREAIRHYLYGITFLPACRFCAGRSFSAPEIVPAVQTPEPVPYRRLHVLGAKPGDPP